MASPRKMKAKWSDFYPKMKAVCEKCTENTIYVYLRNTVRLRKLVSESEEIPKSSGWLKDDTLFKAWDKLNLSQRRLLGTAAVKSLKAYGTTSPKWDKKLAEAAGLTQFGVNLSRLPAGAWSGQRHWHTRCDEFIYVVAGEVVLVSDDGEEILRAGDAAGFPAGDTDAHCFQNRSD